MGNCLRREKSNDYKNKYTVVHNRVFSDGRLTFKDIGVFVYMWHLPKDWNYSERGLISRRIDGLTGLNTSLKHLEKYGYLSISRHYGGHTTWILSDMGRVKEFLTRYVKTNKLNTNKSKTNHGNHYAIQGKHNNKIRILRSKRMNKHDVSLSDSKAEWLKSSFNKVSALLRRAFPTLQIHGQYDTKCINSWLSNYSFGEIDKVISLARMSELEHNHIKSPLKYIGTILRNRRNQARKQAENQFVKKDDSKKTKPTEQDEIAKIEMKEAKSNGSYF